MSLLLLGSGQVSHAQDLDYLYQLGQEGAYGDARFIGMSGAMTALSGSMTAVLNNPAAAGLYRQNVVSLDGGAFMGRNFTSTGRPMDQTSNVNVGNFAFLGIDPVSKIRYFFSYNMDQVYREAIEFSASGSSIMSQWIDNSLGTAPDFLPNVGIYEELLYEVYGTDWDENAAAYFTTADVNATQYDHNLSRRGMRNRWTFGGGYNIQPTLQVGASVHLVHSFENVDVFHNEFYPVTTDLTRLDLEESWENSALGVGGNVGLQYRPAQWLRLGAALELPQVYAFNQDWTVELTSARPSISNNISRNARGFDYQWTVLTAPKVRSGAAIVFGRNGLLSINHTLIPHTWTSALSRNERYLNAPLDERVGTQHLFAAGAEWRLGPLSLRGGAAFSPAHYEGFGDYWQQSLGFAFTGEDFTFHFGWLQTQQQKRYYPFQATYSSASFFDRTVGMISMGGVWKL